MDPPPSFPPSPCHGFTHSREAISGREINAGKLGSVEDEKEEVRHPMKHLAQMKKELLDVAEEEVAWWRGGGREGGYA
jgi:hypothetical protein